MLLYPTGFGLFGLYPHLHDAHNVCERFHTQVFAKVIFKTKYFQRQDGSSYLQSPSSAPGTKGSMELAMNN